MIYIMYNVCIKYLILYIFQMIQSTNFLQKYILLEEMENNNKDTL